ncbi:acetyltransferase [Chryseobacterium sp. TY3]
MSLYLYGASGHGKVVLEIAEALKIPVEAFIDGDQTKLNLLSYPIVHHVPENVEITLSLGNNVTRKNIANQLSDYVFKTLIHPNAQISKRAELGAGSVVMAGVSINSCSKIGEHCIINTNAAVDHDCILEDFVHISPNASLAGNVKIGELTQIGIGSCVIQGVKIGKNCMIGAGSVVIRDIPDNAIVVGNPARIIKYRQD